MSGELSRQSTPGRPTIAEMAREVRTERWGTIDPCDAAGYLLEEVVGVAAARWVRFHAEELGLDSEGAEEAACEIGSYVTDEACKALDELEREARIGPER